MHSAWLIGLFAAAGLAAAYFYLRGNARPLKGTILDRLEGTVRLRDIFRLAAGLELEGVDFYRGLSELARDPAVKALCLRLAGEETKHLAAFKGQLDRWRALPGHRRLEPALLNDAKEKGIFLRSPGPGASEEEMASYAIAQEIKSAEFYKAFEQAFPEAWKREHISGLILEERRHEQDLRAAYPRLELSPPDAG